MMQTKLVILTTLAVLTLATSCSNGTIIVSDPQVFTRERLVQERFDESQWLEKELDQAPTKVTYQGLRDYREFVGIYNELRATADPLQGQLNTLDNKVQQKRKELELAKAEKALADFLLKDGESPETGAGTGAATTSAATSSTGATTSPIATKQETATQPSTATPLPASQSRKLADPSSFQLPKGTQGELATNVSPGILDLFHDRLAYRNAVRAAMREKQLDDSHDLFGLMMYDFQFDLTLRPGKDVSQFAQIRLTLEAPFLCPSTEGKYAAPLDKAKRKSTAYDELYKGWVRHLQDNYRQETLELQNAFLAGHLDPDQINRILRFIQHELDNTFVDRMVSSLTRLGSTTDSTTKKQELERLPQWQRDLLAAKGVPFKQLLTDSDSGGADLWTPEYLSNKYRSPFFRNAVAAKSSKQAFSSHLKTLNSKLPNILKNPSGSNSQDKAAILLAIGWMIHEKARSLDLSKYLNISHPEAGNEFWSIEQNSPVTATSDFVLQISPIDTSESETAPGEFTNTLCEAGNKKLRASSIEPKEYAQNVSDVAARETLINLVSSLAATLPQNGVSAANYSEYARKTQEYVQAINRTPLAIGFGEGHSTFGWIFGPKFAIKSPGWFSWLGAGSLVEFSHVPVKHSFRASVVVPGWWDQVKLKWECGWINDSGTEPDLTYCGNHDDFTYIDLPMPRERWDAITKALLRSSETTRPIPIITHPPAYDSNPAPSIITNTPSPVILEFDSKKPSTSRQGLLIQGTELWRNPQVFLGQLPASKVKILSDMKSLYATFDMTLMDPSMLNNDKSPGKDSGPYGIFVDKGIKRLDLTVITSAGSDTKTAAVIYQPAPSSDLAKKPTAIITSPMVIQSKTKLTLTVDETSLPDPKLPLMLRALPVGVKGAQWLRAGSSPESQGKPGAYEAELNSFIDTTGATKPLEGKTTGDPLEVQLSLIAQNYPGDVIGQELLSPDARTIVLYKNETQAKAILAAANNKISISKLKSDAPFSADKAIRITIPVKPHQDLFYKAYPDLRKAGIDKKIEVILRPKGGQPGTQVIFSTDYADKAEPHEILVKADDLAKKATEFPGPTRETPGRSDYEIILTFGQTTIDVIGDLTIQREQ